MSIHVSIRSNDTSRGANLVVSMDVHHSPTSNEEVKFEVLVRRTESSINLTAREWNHALNGGESRCSEVCHYLDPQQARDLAQRLIEQADAFEQGAVNVDQN